MDGQLGTVDLRRRTRVLLAIESCLTAVPFTVSWLVCAISLSIKAGYLMAKAESDQKTAILDKLWGGGDKS